MIIESIMVFLQKSLPIMGVLLLLAAVVLKMSQKSKVEAPQQETDMAVDEVEKKPAETIQVMLNDEGTVEEVPEERTSIDFGLFQGIKFGLGFGIGLSLWGLIVFMLLYQAIITMLKSALLGQ